MHSVCPKCREAVDIPEYVAEGQHVLCPWCSKKSSWASGQLIPLRDAVATVTKRPSAASVAMWMLVVVACYQIIRIIIGVTDLFMHNYEEDTISFAFAIMFVWTLYTALNLFAANGYRIGSKSALYIVNFASILFLLDVIARCVGFRRNGISNLLEGLLPLLYYGIPFFLNRRNDVSEWLHRVPFWKISDTSKS